MFNKWYNLFKYGLVLNGLFWLIVIVIMDELFDCIMFGMIIVKIDVECFMEYDVIFIDGIIVKDIDVVVFGIGYLYDFLFFEDGVIRIEN